MMASSYLSFSSLDAPQQQLQLPILKLGICRLQLAEGFESNRYIRLQRCRFPVQVWVLSSQFYVLGVQCCVLCRSERLGRSRRVQVCRREAFAGLHFALYC
jgi:hypothetical protein